MARIRTIKPEFWSDEKLSPCSPLTRLVFLGLIGMADDCGRLLDNVKRIDAFIFPETSETCHRSLTDLSVMRRIRRGKTSSGQAIIQIVNWDAHQRIEKPNIKGSLPPIVGDAPAETVTPQRVRRNSPTRRRKLTDESGKDHRHVTDESPLHTNDQRPTTVVPTTEDQERSDADAPVGNGKRGAWLTPYLELWNQRVGVVTPERAATSLAPVRRRYGDAKALAGLTAYLDEPRSPGERVKLEYFKDDAARWIRESETPLVVDGVLTERGRRVSS